MVEMVEYDRSPGLRKRIHPKRDADADADASVGVADSPRGRLGGVSRDSDGSADGERVREARASPKRPPLSDLDVQIAHGPRLGLSADRPPQREERRPPPAERGGRYGAVISNTVDAWARQTVHLRDGTYKPLIFGGTYPIDAPASPPEVRQPPAKKVPVAEVRATVDGEAHRRDLRKTIERSLDKFEAILARRESREEARRRAFSKRVVNTFDIDEPVSLAEPPKAATLEDEDAKYYVSGPKTFDIDEPVSFI